MAHLSRKQGIDLDPWIPTIFALWKGDNLQTSSESDFQGLRGETTALKTRLESNGCSLFDFYLNSVRGYERASWLE